MKTDIYHLLEKYFEGDTSAEEEKRLHLYFSQDNLPEDLKVYASLFRFLDDESAALRVLHQVKQESEVVKRRKPLFLRKLWSYAAVAAVLLAAVLLLVRPDKQSHSMGDSYVWVDGKQITNPTAVREYAESAFGKIQPENDLIEDQLRFMLE